MYNAQFWANAWAEYRQSGNKRRPDPQAREEFWNHFSGRYAKHNDDNRQIHQDIIDNLAAQGAVQAGDTLLDIGCGPGTYALPLAAKGVKVTGLDTAGQMLAALKDKALKTGLSAMITTRKADWNDLPSEPSYDIAFAAKSPAINDYDSLMKMTKIARKFCCLIGFAGRHTLELRHLLWEKLLQEPAPAPSFDIIYPLNILYQEGYRPNLSFYSYSNSEQEPLNYLWEHYTRYFSMLGVSGPDVEAGIHSFLQERAVDGYCTEKSATTVGVMWWKVN
ncbi:SAM-dependent methyltransferase [Sporomusa acidovorans]|uniref:Methyltransferase domain-containing protein n=1 Tax=Sporomusa acidovorans (strain ATCC 49682 / DSM 3132 / Mol) TaxID=1123286 RepID=A0ABZ3IY36_SPOA4|nr:class I SAM-dependent methyltransferase [Sporomusa acidovorans]OZC17686.1 demethylrebeccamycin-D-glucose O-methyltransferase [Sporomusa acidovorans DSM 3132]SDE12076.1 Methyltransferase domain-containing protein [Sporomusa acidovorans]